MLNLYKLEIFTIVVEVGSFSKAAERLLLTQSAISQHIGDLENSLGTRLFERGARGVTLTPAGETLQRYTLEILRLVAEAENAVTDVHNVQNGQVSICATPGINIYLLPSWIADFRKEFPHLTLSVQTATTAHVIERLFEHKIDLGIVEGELDDKFDNALGRVILQDIDLFVVVGPSHPFWEYTQITITDLNNQICVARQQGSQTRTWVDAIFKQHRIQAQIVAEFDNQESIKHAVQTGMGITLLPEYAVQHEIAHGTLRIIPVEGVDLKREIKLIWDANHLFNPITTAFLRYLAERFPDIHKVLQKH